MTDDLETTEVAEESEVIEAVDEVEVETETETVETVEEIVESEETEGKDVDEAAVHEVVFTEETVSALADSIADVIATRLNIKEISDTVDILSATVEELAREDEERIAEKVKRLPKAVIGRASESPPSKSTKMKSSGPRLMKMNPLPRGKRFSGKSTRASSRPTKR